MGVMKLLLLTGPCLALLGEVSEKQWLKNCGFAVSLVALGIAMGRMWIAMEMMIP